MPDEAEDQRGDGGEELLVVSEINPKGFRDGENELSVRKLEEELFVEIFGEKEGAFLGAGRAKIESFTGKRTKILQTACGIAALNTSDAFCVVAAAFEFVHHMRDTFQAELAEVLGVEGVVGIGEGAEMVVEDTSQDIRLPRNIGGGRCGRDREGR